MERRWSRKPGLWCPPRNAFPGPEKEPESYGIRMESVWNPYGIPMESLWNNTQATGEQRAITAGDLPVQTLNLKSSTSPSRTT